MNLRKMWAMAVAMLALTGTAQAGLIDRGGGMIYDTILNITWLSDWRYAWTSGFDPDGQMDWMTANNWANNLVYGGYSDWRLPTSLNADGSGPCDGFNCTGSEMGHMFYENWGATADNSFSSGTNAANLALFSNVQSYVYWSGTDYAPNAIYVWTFLTGNGYQRAGDDADALYAVAVRDGDSVASVPEAQTMALVLMGLGAAIFGWRRRIGQRQRVLRRLGVA